MWAHCPTCKHTQRFQRVGVNHWLHAFLTVITLGLWGVSWAAVTIGYWLKPWRCKQCEGSDHGTPKKRLSQNSPPNGDAQPAG